MRRAWAAMLLAWLGAVHATGPARGAPAADPEHTILVMLRSPPDHFRPDSGYGGDYGNLSGRAARMRIARRIARAHKLRVTGDWPMPLLAIDCIVMTIGDGRSPSEAAAEVAREAGVAWSQPLARFHGQAQPRPAPDPLLAAQPAEQRWRITALHRLATGKGVAVAVIDSAIDRAHPDLAGQIAYAHNFVAGRAVSPERHGTEVAGVIAARAGNGVGIAGVAPEARLLALRACWDAGGPGGATLCDSLSLAKALSAAIEHRAQIINLSLSGPYDVLLARLIDVAIAAGADVVAAIDPQARAGGFPAMQPGVIAVADKPMAGERITVYIAPGEDIPTTAPGGVWMPANGSSFAAAHVSGLMALARGRGGGLVRVPIRSAGGEIDACRTILCPPDGRARSCGGDCARIAP